MASGRYSVSIGHSQNAGHHSVYGTIGSQRTSQVLADPMVGQQRLGPDIRRLGSENYSTRFGHPPPVLMGVSNGISRTLTPRSKKPILPCLQMPPSMYGGSTRRLQYQWTVVRGAMPESHQYPRNGSRVLCCPWFPQQITWPCVSLDVRHYNSSILHQAGRRDQVIQTG